MIIIKGIPTYKSYINLYIKNYFQAEFFKFCYKREINLNQNITILSMLYSYLYLYLYYLNHIKTTVVLMFSCILKLTYIDDDAAKISLLTYYCTLFISMNSFLL